MENVTLEEIRNFKHRINPEERQGAFGYYFIRPLSVYITYFCIKHKISANQVTTMQLLVGMLGAFFLAIPNYFSIILGVILLQFGFVLDNVDGEIARFTGNVSITGKFLDSIGHIIVVSSMFMGLGIGNYLQFGNFVTVVWGFLAGMASLRFDYAIMYQEAAQFLESRKDLDFDYYTLQPPHDDNQSENLYRKKNEESSSRILYALFAYPATMNIITVIVLIDAFALKPNWFAEVNFIYSFLMVYGTLLPLRRAYTIWKLTQNKEVEKKFAQLLLVLKSAPNQN